MKRTTIAAGLMLLAGATACGGGGKEAEGAAGSPTHEARAAKKGPGKVIDMTDNKEVERIALASLEAYRNKDMRALAALGPPKAKETLIFLEPRNPNYATLLGDDTWRMKALRAWDGKLDQLVRGIDDVALGWFHEDAEARYAVELHKDNGHWEFFDLHKEPKAKPAAPPP